MAGFFAAAAKTPFSTLVIVSEMTGNYSLLLPTLWVCTLAFLLSDEQSIYSSQILSRSLSPAQDTSTPNKIRPNLWAGRHGWAEVQAFLQVLDGGRLYPGNFVARKPNITILAA
jgi:hypothetical protein